MKYSIMLDIVGLEHEHLDSGLVPNIEKIVRSGESSSLQPVFPAVTCTVQASLLTGKYPADHGIIANGMYNRSTYEVSFWDQPSSLVQTKRIWDIVKQKNESTYDNNKTAVLFFQNIMYANSD